MSSHFWCTIKILNMEPAGLAPKIAEELRTLIKKGEYVSGELPKADELCKKLKSQYPKLTSVQPVRTALSILVGEGLLLSPKHRRDTFKIQRKPKGLISLVGYDPYGDFMGGVIDGINEELGLRKARGEARIARLVSAFLSEPQRNLSVDRTTEEEDKLVREMQGETDGIIFLPSGRIDRMPTLVGPRNRFPLVFLGPGNQPNDFKPVSGVHQVIYSEREIALRIGGAVEKFIKEKRFDALGVIAIVGESLNSTLARRALEIHHYLTKLQMRPLCPLSRRSREKAGADGIGELHNSDALKRRNTLVIATTDLAAIGARARLKEIGLDVPDDVMILSVDDDKSSEFAGLTSLKLHPKTIGAVATQTLFRLIEGDRVEETETLVSSAVGNVIYRASTSSRASRSSVLG